MNPLLMGVVIVLVALLAIGGSFFFAVAMMWFGVLIYDEIIAYKNEPRLTRVQKIQKEIEYEKFLDDLLRDHRNRPINVLRDGVRV